jgi:hypothetical protein
MSNSKNFFCSRGCVYETNFNAYFNRGAFLLSPPMYSPKTPILIRQVSVQKKDIVDPMSMLNNKKLLFTFGQAWGQIVIQGTVLLGCTDIEDKDGGTQSVGEEIAERAIGAVAGAVTGVVGDGLRLVESYFDAYRASKYAKPLNLSALRYSKTLKFFLTEYNRGKFDANLNTVDFTFKGLVFDRQAEGLLEKIVDQL